MELVMQKYCHELSLTNQLYLLFSVLSLFAVLTPVVDSNCPLYGCSPSCSFSSAAEFVSPDFQPRIIWDWQSEGLRPSGDGCVTNAARVVCTVFGDKKAMLISWDAADDGKSHWNVSLEKTVSLPLMDFSGSVVASDGHKLVGYQSDGVPMGKAIKLYPIVGHLFDLNLINNKFILLYKCGFLVAYLTNGIPHASIWLNDTINGVNGTFIPLSNPAGQDERMYVLTAFKPWNHNSERSKSEGNVYLRVYAISVLSTLNYRIRVDWFYDKIVSNISIPYLDDRKTVCSVRHIPEDSKDGLDLQNVETDFEEKLTVVNSEPVAHVTVIADTVFVLFNYYADVSEDTANGSKARLMTSIRSNVLVIQDLNKNCSVKYMKEFQQPFQAVGFDSSPPDRELKPPTNSMSMLQEESYVWIAFNDLQTNQSLLLQLGNSNGTILSTISMSELLGAKTVRITSKMSFLHHQESSRFHEKTVNPLVFCILVDTSKAFVVALNVGTGSSKPLWLLDAGEPCLGQISTVDRAQDSLLVVTNTTGISVYLLTHA